MATLWDWVHNLGQRANPQVLDLRCLLLREKVDPAFVTARWVDFDLTHTRTKGGRTRLSSLDIYGFMEVDPEAEREVGERLERYQKERGKGGGVMENPRVYCRCPGRFCWQVTDLRRCEGCRGWVCVDCQAAHREECARN